METSQMYQVSDSLHSEVIVGSHAQIWYFQLQTMQSINIHIQHTCKHLHPQQLQDSGAP